ncbi:hypothetical protein HGA88_04150 [Candidatus Roizmanbacteria bacterium]|nr:hypothetical protein [Candidatus Roizmanbacteria bacterium]
MQKREKTYQPIDEIPVQHGKTLHEKIWTVIVIVSSVLLILTSLTPLLFLN